MPAVKISGALTGTVNFDDNGDIRPEVQIAAGTERGTTSLGPYSPALGALLVNLAIKGDIADYADSQWGATPQGAVVLIGGVTII